MSIFFILALLTAVLGLSVDGLRRSVRVHSHQAEEKRILRNTTMATEFCQPSPIRDLGCKRLGGWASGVLEKDLLSSLSHIEYGLRGTANGGFGPEDVVGDTVQFQLLTELKGQRVAAHYSMVWEPQQQVEEEGEDPTDAEDFYDIATDLNAPLATVLRGEEQTSEAFISLGLPELMQREGKYYYEFELRQGHTMAQIGFAARPFVTLQNNKTEAEMLASQGNGIGDDQFSWGVDGQRKMKYHLGFDGEEWSLEWRRVAIVGCAIDIDNGFITYSVNGEWEAEPAFTYFAGNFREGVYPAGTLQGRGSIRLAGFSFEPPEGFKPWPRKTGYSDVLNTWDRKVDGEAQLKRAQLPVNGGGMFVDRTMVLEHKSRRPDFGVVEEVFGNHVVIRFDGERKNQEVPIEWLVARLSKGTRVLLRHQSRKGGVFDRIVASVEESSPEGGTTARLSSGRLVKVTKKHLVSEMTAAKKHLVSELTASIGLSWRMVADDRAGEVVGVVMRKKRPDVVKGFVLRPDNRQGASRDLFVAAASVESGGPKSPELNCQQVCWAVLSQLHEPYEHVENVPLSAKLPEEPEAFGKKLKVRGTYHGATKPRSRIQGGSQSLLEELLEETSSSTEKINDANGPQDGWYNCTNCQDHIERAKWAFAGYFGAVPSFTAMDMKSFEDLRTDLRNSGDARGKSDEEITVDLIKTMQQQALLARQWILLAMGTLADMRIGNKYMKARENATRSLDAMLGGHSQDLLDSAFETFEAAYVSIINSVFRYEPITKIEADWTKDLPEPVYVSKLYQQGECTEEDYKAHYCMSGCEPGTYAYVFPRGPNSVDEHGRRIVNLCPLFFQQTNDLSGLDDGMAYWQGTRVGTLIHEVSHHLPSGTSDVVHEACARTHGKQEEEACYGYKACERLAETDSQKALINADNYLYVTEMLVRGTQKHEKKWNDINQVMSKAKSLQDLTELVDLLEISKR